MTEPGPSPLVFSISGIVAAKRRLALVPDVVRIVACLALALVLSTILLGLPLRVFGMAALAFAYGAEMNVVLFGIGVATATLLFLAAAFAVPLVTLSRIENDSRPAIGVGLLLCLAGGYGAWISELDGEAPGLVTWGILAALAVPTLGLLAHGAYLASLRGRRSARALTVPRVAGHRLHGRHLGTRIRLFATAVGPLALTLAAVFVIGSLLWIPIALVGLFAPSLALLIAVGAFVAARRRFAEMVLDGLRQFRSRMQRNAGELLALDDRQPILFLRSFRDDDVAIGNASGSIISFVLGLPLDVRRLEECIVDAVCRLGPVVALDRPGSNLPDLGAAKTKVQGDDWKGVVSHYLDQARLIVMVFGTTEGLLWEVEEIFRRGYGGKLVIVAPPGPDLGAAALFDLCLGPDRGPMTIPEGEGVLAIGGGRRPSDTLLVVASTDDATSYRLAIQYCINAMTEH